MSVDLSTTYLGLRLRNPIVVAACPLTADVDSLRSLESAGARAAVLPSLFEEQIEHDEMQLHELYERYAAFTAESSSFMPVRRDYNTGPDAYLRHIETAKAAVGIPLIASLNGTSK
ncbi:MAG: hypothetical protein FJ297_10750 [Planctomycetes bacterium]|nr:hypothetical protein [Planctomycetota bacterium]